MNEHYLNLDELLNKLPNAEFLSKCGGPYSDISETITVEATLKLSASEAAEGRIFSVVCGDDPITKIDEEYLAAEKKVKSILWKKIFFISFETPLTNKHKQMKAAIKHIFYEKDKEWSQRNSGLYKYVAYHYENLFTAVGGLIVANIQDEFPLLVKASRIALDGYLPLDIIIENGKPKLLIY